MKRLLLLATLIVLVIAVWWRHERAGAESKSSHVDELDVIASPLTIVPTARTSRTVATTTRVSPEDAIPESPDNTLKRNHNAAAHVKTTPKLFELQARAPNSANDAHEYAMALSECTAALRRPFADSELSRGAFADYHALMNGTDLSQALLGSRREECQQLLGTIAPDQRWKSLVDRILLAWDAAAAQGDPYARLVVLTRNWTENTHAPQYAQAQDLGMKLLNINDPSTLVRLAPRMRAFGQFP